MNLSGTTLLVVDDSRVIRQSVRIALRELSLAITEADSYEAALRVGDAHFSVALIDARLPDGDGYELALRLRGLFPELQIIMLTSREAPFDHTRGAHAQVAEAIEKPFLTHVLAETVQRLLDGGNVAVPKAPPVAPSRPRVSSQWTAEFGAPPPPAPAAAPPPAPAAAPRWVPAARPAPAAAPRVALPTGGLQYGAPPAVGGPVRPPSYVAIPAAPPNPFPAPSPAQAPPSEDIVEFLDGPGVAEPPAPIDQPPAGPPLRALAALPESPTGPAHQGASIVGEADADAVDCALFCPPAPMVGDRFLVQVFLHTPSQQQAAYAAVREADPDAERRGRKRLRLPIARGTTVQVELRATGLSIEPPGVEELVWTGEPESAQFEVMVPWHYRQNTAVLKVVVSVAGVPLGVLRGQIGVSRGATLDPHRTVPREGGGHAVRFEKAFASYASEDREEVLKRVQAIRLCNVDCFQDIVDLSPGERWARELYRRIDDCDAFFLFWSKAASQSEWVLKEAHYALSRQHGDEDAPPEILPLVIERPVPPPPPALAHLHFNDPLLYFMKTPPG